MRLVFFGTAEFAVPSLRALLNAGHEITAVVTAPPRPAGRGQRLRASPVDDAARRIGLNVLQPLDPNDPAFVNLVVTLQPELGVLVAYGSILRRRLLEIPRRGMLNLHPSLLPRYRGAAPIQRCLMDGVQETGVAVIRMERKVDAGAIAALERTPVGPEETAGELSARLAEAGARLLVAVVDRMASGEVTAVPQDHTCASTAPKITKTDRAVDWNRPAARVHNLIRALSPEPGAVTALRGRRLVLLRSRPVAQSATGPPGTVMVECGSLTVACADTAVELLELRPEGGKTVCGTDFIHGYRLKPGERMVQP